MTATCDLSHKNYTLESIERGVHAFTSVMRINLSNNALTGIPWKYSSQLFELNVAFNVIEDVRGLELLPNLKVLNLSYNRISDISPVECCRHLKSLDLKGNRVKCTKGIERLYELETLDLSDNLLEQPDTLRLLSFNTVLTTLSLKGNPIAINTDYRVLILDLLINVQMLDGKRLSRQGPVLLKGKSANSYAYIHDEKKQYNYTMKKNTPLLETTVYDNNNNNNDVMVDIYDTRKYVDVNVTTPNGSYMSLYDRLAEANGILAQHNKIEESVAAAVAPRKGSPTHQQCHTNTNATTTTTTHTQRRYSSKTKVTLNTKLPPSISPPKRNESFAIAQTSRRRSNSSHTIKPLTVLQISDSFIKDMTIPPHPHIDRSPFPGGSSVCDSKYNVISPSQSRVLSVIQELIQHKRQTIASLRL